jgi:hypothetical protein
MDRRPATGALDGEVTPVDVIGAGDCGPIDARAARFGLAQPQSAQRQAAASRIGQLQGNQRLQTAVIALKPEMRGGKPGIQPRVTHTGQPPAVQRDDFLRPLGSRRRERPEETLPVGTSAQGPTPQQKSVLIRGTQQLIDLHGLYRSPTYPNTLSRPLTVKLPSFWATLGGLGLGAWALKKAAETYQSLADKAVQWRAVGVLNKYISLSGSGLKAFVRKALREHKPYLAPLLDARDLSNLRQNVSEDVISHIGTVFSQLDTTLNVLDPLYGSLCAQTAALGATVGMISIALSVYDMLKALAEAHTAGEKLSYALGVAYGVVALALGKYAEISSRISRFAKYPSHYRKGYAQAKAYYKQILQKGPAARVAVTSQLLALKRLGGDRAIKAVWPTIRDSYLASLWTTRGMYTKINYLGWPPF